MEWLFNPVFLPGEFHGHRSLTGYNPWGHKESDMTERLSYFNFKKKSFFKTSDINKAMQLGIFSFLLKNKQNQKENEKENPHTFSFSYTRR